MSLDAKNSREELTSAVDGTLLSNVSSDRRSRYERRAAAVSCMSATLTASCSVGAAKSESCLPWPAAALSIWQEEPPTGNSWASETGSIPQYPKHQQIQSDADCEGDQNKPLHFLHFSTTTRGTWGAKFASDQSMNGKSRGRIRGGVSEQLNN
jgi:hypothetical protein